jgi:tRNA U34 5-methylaminomethyl-2-thiouridine-forming methyltransferase MnmC
MARSARVSITRLRFRGHTNTLNALCQAFHDHPHQAMTVAELAESTGRPFADVHQRLSETPELFTALPKTPTTNTRYRLTLRMERKTAEEIARFVDDAKRSETRIAAAFVGAFVALFVMLSVMSALY